MSNTKDLAFWQDIVNFPLRHVDLLYFDQLLQFFKANASATTSSEIWTDSMRDKIRTHFNSCGLHEVPDCLDIYE